MINFADNYVSGLEAIIMQSDDNASKIISAFKEVINQGLNPEDYEADIYNELNINPNDLTWYDKEKITNEVNDYWEAVNA